MFVSFFFSRFFLFRLLFEFLLVFQLLFLCLGSIFNWGFFKLCVQGMHISNLVCLILLLVFSLVCVVLGIQGSDRAFPCLDGFEFDVQVAFPGRVPTEGWFSSLTLAMAYTSHVSGSYSIL